MSEQSPEQKPAVEITFKDFATLRRDIHQERKGRRNSIVAAIFLGSTAAGGMYDMAHGFVTGDKALNPAIQGALWIAGVVGAPYFGLRAERQGQRAKKMDAAMMHAIRSAQPGPDVLDVPVTGLDQLDGVEVARHVSITAATLKTTLESQGVDLSRLQQLAPTEAPSQQDQPPHGPRES